jgi:hypothetical protein
MKARLGVLTCLAVAIAAASTQAAGSPPAAGNWSGSVKSKPASPLTFMVTAKGRKRTVSDFVDATEFKGPCTNAETSIGGIPNATVASSGTFKAKGTENSGFGAESWTVSGKFKGGHASGTVAIVLAVSSTKRCDFTVKWSAALEGVGHPIAGAAYSGKETTSQMSVKFRVTPNGKEISTITWGQPLTSDCPGASSNPVFVTGKDVPIHGSKFSYTQHTGKISHGTGSTVTETITGEFLAGHKAQGTVSTSADMSSLGTDCQGNDTWSAKG